MSPLDWVDGIDQEVSPVGATVRRRTRRSVLVVDDNVDAALLLGALLGEAGHASRSLTMAPVRG